ncbi:hypothetical protein FHR37_004246 [Actinopolymorpha cephalotaxi]|uniref:Uncharacterized protein n=1 Tax=Actinopolymorpha cephalotaxi TaxID=504797 RepID=A0ABX2SAA8_9ACTN|nr:hypothetical protein [Actinopolymorpha cephalotaxi]
MGERVDGQETLVAVASGESYAPDIVADALLSLVSD